jgi:hypothetical protein
MVESTTPPPSLRDLVSREFVPVAPLRKAWVRALAVLPLAVILLFAAPFVFGVRADAGELGWLLTWGASWLQLAAGMWLVTVALRTAVPGRAPADRNLVTALGLAIAAVVTTTFVTWVVSPTSIADESVAYVSEVCFTHTLLGAVPVISMATLLAARALPQRPLVTGALLGTAGGLLSDAGWRLFCHYSDPLHVLPTHLGAIVAATFIGVVAGAIVRWRQRTSAA